MLKRKNMIIVIVSLFIITFVTSSYVQAKNINENEFIDNHIEALLKENIAPKNRLPKLDIQVKTNSIQYNNAIAYSLTNGVSEPQLHKETTSLDVIPLDNSNERFLVTALVKQTFKVPINNNLNNVNILNESIEKKTYCDVNFSYSAVYDHYTYQGADCYKVIKYKGGYISKTDPQMTCKSIKFKHRASGRFYTSSTSLATKKIDYSPKTKTITTPSKGKIYTYSIKQPGYVVTPPGYSAGRFYFVVARTTSSFSKQSHIGIDFGDVLSISK